MRDSSLGYREIACRGCGSLFIPPRKETVYCSRECSNKTTGPKLSARANTDEQRPIAWACGAGVDSTAIAVLICQGKLPKPTYAWIVDVGYEPKTTWAYVADVLQPKLSEVGVTLHILKTTDYTQNDLVRDGHATIPAYRKKEDGSIQKFHTHCSNGWKARVAERWLRQQGAVAIEQWVGISAEERKRIRTSEKAWVRLRYPLVERGMTRNDCIYLIGQAGWPLPERTSCYLCPHRSLGDWRRLAARNFEDFQRAVDAEKVIQITNPDVFLHSSGKPLDVAVNGCASAGEKDSPSGCEVGLFSCS